MELSPIRLLHRSYSLDSVPLRVLLFAGVVTVCAVVCILLIGRLGQSALIITVIPVVLIAVKYGKLWGLAGALISFGFNSLLVLNVLGPSWIEWLKSGGAFGHGALTGVALLVGWLQETRSANLRLATEHEELGAIARLVGSSLEPCEIYPEFARHVGELISFDWIGINIIDDESQTLQLCYMNGFGAANANMRVETPDRSFASEVIHSDGLIIDEQAGLHIAQRLPGLQKGFEDLSRSIEQSRFGGVSHGDRSRDVTLSGNPVDQIRSLLGVPLIDGSDKFGALVLISCTANAYSAKDLEMAIRVARQVSGAISKARLFAEKTRKTEQMETLFKISKILSRPESIESKSKQVLETVRTQVGADSGVIRILDPATESLKLVAKDGLISGEWDSNLSLAEEGIPQRIFNTGKSSLLTDYATDPGAKPISVEHGICSVYGIPLCGASGPVGLLTLAARSPGHFNPERRDFLESIADEMAVLFDSAILSENLAATQKEIAVVDEIARIMASTLDLRHVYQQFFDRLKTIVQFDLAGVVVINEETGMLDMEFLSDPDLSSFHIGDSSELSGSVVSDMIGGRQTVIINDISQRSGFRASKQLELDGFQSMIQTPLISDEKVIGAFALFSRQKNSFGPHERDITERLAGQIAPSVRNAQMYQREAQLATALESIGEAVAFLDTKAVYRRVNRAFEELYGYTEDEVRGQPTTNLSIWDSSQAEKNREILEQGISSGWSGEVVRKTKSGENLDILLTVAPVKNSHGKVSGRVIISRDITERKKAETRLNETSRLASLGELAAGVAHEINNPLTSILLCSELLTGSDVPDRMLTDLEVITSSAQRAAKVVQKLLLFARREESEPALSQMTSIVSRALELKRSDLKIKGINVHLGYSHDLPHSWIDEHQMTQVIVNILNNAEQAVASQGQGGNIGIKISMKGEQVLTAIEDDGPGIPADILQKIFEPFFTTKEVGEGTGLGLSIGFGIVKEHGGEMWAESVLNKGATFYIQIPTAEEQAAAVGSPGKEKSEFAEIRRLLIVDDEPEIRDMVSRGLRNEFRHIDVAASGMEAQEMVRSEDYDCILLDISMDGMDGMELYRQAAANDQQSAKKIILMTGDTVSPTVRSFLASVDNIVIPKPFSLEEVRKGVSSIMAN